MAGSNSMPSKGLSSGEGRFCLAKIHLRWRIIRSSQVSPGTGTRAVLALCHGAPGGNWESPSASKGGTVISMAGIGAGQPSPALI
eukprot:6480453-Amphidinium_carterae.1